MGLSSIWWMKVLDNPAECARGSLLESYTNVVKYLRYYDHVMFPRQSNIGLLSSVCPCPLHVCSDPFMSQPYPLTAKDEALPASLESLREDAKTLGRSMQILREQVGGRSVCGGELLR